LASSPDPDPTRDLDGAPVGDSTTPVAEALESAASHDLIVMAVGAVMALHAVHEAKARVALAGVATHFQVPVSAVAEAVLILVAGTDEPCVDEAGRAATQLLVQGFTHSP